MSTKTVATIGAGRMGRGIALAYALNGQRVTIVDFKPRNTPGWETLQADVWTDLRLSVQQLAELGALDTRAVETTLGNIQLCAHAQAAGVLAQSRLVYEAVPETLDAKRDALGRVAALVSKDVLIASTTSTMLASDLAPLVTHPERFMNAHWLNPAWLIPLVEISANEKTDPAAIAHIKEELTRIGKVPVVCACSPGFIVPRLQTLLMNEAARMAEEGVATPEQVDLATRYGLGFRFAAMGVLEFIDFGGNDILYHASRYLADNIDATRFTAPGVVQRHMHEGRNGMRDARGFHDYDGVDLAAYKRDVLARLLAMSEHFKRNQKEAPK